MKSKIQSSSQKHHSRSGSRERPPLSPHTASRKGLYVAKGWSLSALREMARLGTIAFEFPRIVPTENIQMLLQSEHSKDNKHPHSRIAPSV